MWLSSLTLSSTEKWKRNWLGAADSEIGSVDRGGAWNLFDRLWRSSGPCQPWLTFKGLGTCMGKSGIFLNRYHGLFYPTGSTGPPFLWSTDNQVLDYVMRFKVGYFFVYHWQMGLINNIIFLCPIIFLTCSKGFNNISESVMTIDIWVIQRKMPILLQHIGSYKIRSVVAWQTFLF